VLLVCLFLLSLAFRNPLQRHLQLWRSSWPPTPLARSAPPAAMATPLPVPFVRHSQLVHPHTTQLVRFRLRSGTEFISSSISICESPAVKCLPFRFDWLSSNFRHVGRIEEFENWVGMGWRSCELWTRLEGS
jgi:hypothetical protein